MSNVPYPDSPIDRYSPYSLRDVLEDAIPTDASEAPDGHNHTEYLGMFLHPEGDGIYRVQPDGHVGGERIDVSEFDDVLEFVDELNSMALFWIDEDDVDVARRFGRQMTRKKELAEENPETHIYVPEDAETAQEPA